MGVSILAIKYPEFRFKLMPHLISDSIFACAEKLVKGDSNRSERRCRKKQTNCS